MAHCEFLGDRLNMHCYFSTQAVRLVIYGHHFASNPCLKIDVQTVANPTDSFCQ